MTKTQKGCFRSLQQATCGVSLAVELRRYLCPGLITANEENILLYVVKKETILTQTCREANLVSGARHAIINSE